MNLCLSWVSRWEPHWQTTDKECIMTFVLISPTIVTYMVLLARFYTRCNSVLRHRAHAVKGSQETHDAHLGT
jgi:hypothetical protein